MNFLRTNEILFLDSQLLLVVSFQVSYISSYVDKYYSPKLKQGVAKFKKNTNFQRKNNP